MRSLLSVTLLLLSASCGTLSLADKPDHLPSHPAELSFVNRASTPEGVQVDVAKALDTGCRGVAHCKNRFRFVDGGEKATHRVTVTLTSIYVDVDDDDYRDEKGRGVRRKGETVCCELTVLVERRAGSAWRSIAQEGGRGTSTVWSDATVVYTDDGERHEIRSEEQPRAVREADVVKAVRAAAMRALRRLDDRIDRDSEVLLASAGSAP